MSRDALNKTGVEKKIHKVHRKTPVFEYLFIKKWLQRKRFSVNFARLLMASTCVSGCFWKCYYNYAWICWFKNFLFDILGRRFTYSFFLFSLSAMIVFSCNDFFRNLRHVSGNAEVISRGFSEFSFPLPITPFSYVLIIHLNHKKSVIHYL